MVASSTKNLQDAFLSMLHLFQLVEVCLLCSRYRTNLHMLLRLILRKMNLRRRYELGPHENVLVQLASSNEGMLHGQQRGLHFLLEKSRHAMCEIG